MLGFSWLDRELVVKRSVEATQTEDGVQYRQPRPKIGVARPRPNHRLNCLVQPKWNSGIPSIPKPREISCRRHAPALTGLLLKESA